MFALINQYDINLHILSHITGILDYLVKNYDCKFTSTEALCKNTNNIKHFILTNFGTIPKYYITFYGIGSLKPIVNELINIGIKIILISDDIHHSIRLAKSRIDVYKKSYINFNTYGYQLNRWNLPNVNNNYFFPHSAYRISDFNENPKNKILVSGVVTDIYPDRKYVSNIKHNSIEILDKKRGIFGDAFYKYLNSYICCFVDTPRDYIVGKVFEICSTGSLLLCMNPTLQNEFLQLGFIDNVNYISCCRDNLMEKIDFITNPSNKQIIDDIRKAGYELIKQKHNMDYRIETFIQILDNTFITEKYTNPKYGTTYMLGF